MCPYYTTCNHNSPDSHPSSIPQPGHSPQIIHDLSCPQNYYNKYFQMHTNIGPNDHLQSDKTSTQNHPNANPKSSQNHNRHPRRHPNIIQTTSNSLQQIIHTSPNDQPHIIQEPTQNHPNITPNIINPSHTFQPFAKVKSTTPQSTMSTNPQSKSNEPSKSNDVSKTTRVTNKPSCETEIKQFQSCQNTITTKTQATNKHSCATEVEQFEAPQ